MHLQSVFCQNAAHCDKYERKLETSLTTVKSGSDTITRVVNASSRIDRVRCFTNYAATKAFAYSP